MLRRALVVGLLSLAACRPAPDPGSVVAGVFDGSGGRWVDLTHAFSQEAVYWPTAKGFALDTVAYGPTPGGWWIPRVGPGTWSGSPTRWRPGPGR